MLKQLDFSNVFRTDLILNNRSIHSIYTFEYALYISSKPLKPNTA